MSISSPLTYQKVTHDNLDLLLRLQHSVWPDSAVDEDYINNVDYPDDTSNVTWIIYRDEIPIGLTGVFTFDPDESGYDRGDSIWMDWFAILPEYRGQGFGKQALFDTINYCRNLGQYRYFRLDTTDRPGRPAVHLYDQVMPLREEYTAERPADPHFEYLIYSCSLGDWPVKPWNNQFLGLNQAGEDEGSIIV